MPIDYRKYPVMWPQVSRQVREMAGQRCEWCGAPNHTHVIREKNGEWSPIRDGYEFVDMDAGEARGGRIVRVILTVAHLGTPHTDGTLGDRTDVHDIRLCNLAALCQWCHLWYDRDHNILMRPIRRDERSGQMRIEA